MTETICTEVSRFRDELVERVPDGGTVDVFEAMLDVSLRIITSTMFSGDVKGCHRELSGHVFEVNRFLKRQIYDIVPLPNIIPTPRNRKFRRAMSYFDRLIMGVIEKRLSTGCPGEDLLGMLLTAKDPETDKPMSLKQARDEAITILVTGHETTATSLTWAYHLLDWNRECRERTYMEIDRVVGPEANALTVDQLADLRYVEQVFFESLRLRPPIWMMYRHVREDCVLGGHQMRKNDTIYVSPYLSQRDERFWSDPLRFDPDRFAPEAERKQYSFFPFGAGPRTCIGAGFASIEARVIMGLLGRKLLFTTDQPSEIVPQPLVTLSPGGPVEMQLRLR